MKKILLLIVLLFTQVAHAGAIGVHVGSVHVPARNFNNFNPGLYYRWDNDWQVGALINSERRLSLYAATTIIHERWSLSLGAITGYKRAKIMPMVAPGFAIINKPSFKTRIILLPQIGPGSSTALHLVVEF